MFCSTFHLLLRLICHPGVDTAIWAATHVSGLTKTFSTHPSLRVYTPPPSTKTPGLIKMQFRNNYIDWGVGLRDLSQVVGRTTGNSLVNNLSFVAS